MARSRARWQRCASASALCLIGALAAAPAAAAPQAPDTADVEEARDAYRLGISLIKQGQWSDALAAFERSARLKPDAVTAFDIGYCERALGRFARARKRLLEALAGGLPADKAVEARGYVAEIGSRLARAVVTLSPAGARVAVDGRPLEDARTELVAGTREPGPPEAVGATSFTLVLDPGMHVIVVSVPGRPDLVVTRELAPGATATLDLTIGSPPSPSFTRRTGAALAFGLGGASAVAGVVFGALALAKKGELPGVCPEKDECEATAQGTIDAMKAFAAASTAGFVAAVAGAGAGTILLLTDSRRAPAAAISIGPGYVGLHGRFLR